MRMLYVGQDDGFLQHGRHYDVKPERKRRGMVEVLVRDGSIEARMTYYGHKSFERDWKDDSPRKNNGS